MFWYCRPTRRDVTACCTGKTNQTVNTATHVHGYFSMIRRALARRGVQENDEFFCRRSRDAFRPYDTCEWSWREISSPEWGLCRWIVSLLRTRYSVVPWRTVLSSNIPTVSHIFELVDRVICKINKKKKHSWTVKWKRPVCLDRKKIVMHLYNKTENVIDKKAVND